MELDYRNTIVAGGDSKDLKFYNLQTGNLEIQIPKAHKGAILDIAVSTHKEIASCSSDGKIKIWNLKRIRQAKTVLEGHTDSIYSISYIPRTTYLLSGGIDKTFRLWNPPTGKVKQVFSSHHKAPIRDILCVPEELYALTASEDKTINVWDIETHTLVKTMHSPEGVFSLAYLPDHQLYLSGSCALNQRSNLTNGHVRVWDIRSKKSCVKSIELDVRVYNSSMLNVKVNGRKIICGHTGNFVDIIDIATWRQMFNWRTCKMGAPGFNPLAVVNDSSFVLCPSDNVIRKYDLQGNVLGKEFVEQLRVHCLQFLGKIESREVVSAIDEQYKLLFRFDDKKFENVRNVEEAKESDARHKRVLELAGDDRFKDVKLLLKGETGDNPKKRTSSLKMKLKVKKFRTFRSFFFATSWWEQLHHTKKVIKVHNLYDIPLTAREHNMIQTILFGHDTMKTEHDYLRMYAFFESVAMYGICFVILKKLERVVDLEFLLRLFYHSFMFFEQSKKDETKRRKEMLSGLFLDNKFRFRSRLNTQLFNIFRGKYFMEIKNSSKYVQVFEKLNLLSSLLEYEVYEIARFEQFQPFINLENRGGRFSGSDNFGFEKVYEETKNMVFSKRLEVNNVTLVTNDFSKIKVCKEYLIAESEYFRGIFADDNDEDDEDEDEDEDEARDKEIVLEGINFAALMIFLRYLFTEKKIVSVDKERIFSAFLLLSELTKDDQIGLGGDTKFVGLLISEIRKVTMTLIDTKSFKLMFESIGYMFDPSSELLNDVIKGYFLSFWVKFFSPKKLIKIIQLSGDRQNMTVKNKELQRQVKNLQISQGEGKEKNKSLGAQIAELENDKRLLEEKVGVLKEQLQRKVDQFETSQVRVQVVEAENKTLTEEKDNVTTEFQELTELYNSIPKLFRKKKKKKKEDKTK